MKRSIRLVGAMTAALLALTISPVMAEPGYYPEGPQRNVDISTVLDGGWTLCFQNDYWTSGDLVSEMLDACSDGLIMLAGRADDESNEILLLAAAPREDVFRVTTGQFEVYLANGTYWYFVPVAGEYAHGMGFSGTDVVDIWTCDWLSSDSEEGALSVEDSETKLCWHLDTIGGDEEINDEGEAILDTGYRIGEITGGLSGYLREVYMAPSGGRVDSLFAQDANFNQKVASCRRDFASDIQALLSPSLSRYESCMFFDVTKGNISRVNADLAAAYKASVTAGKAMTEAEIVAQASSLAIRYNTIDRLITNPESVYATDLINIGLTGLNSVASKYQAINALRYLANQDKDTFSELQAAIAAMKKK